MQCRPALNYFVDYKRRLYGTGFVKLWKTRPRISVDIRIFFTACRSLYNGRIDSVMLVEEGFDVVSTDASDRMLKYALRQRWKRRKEPAFDKWSE